MRWFLKSSLAYLWAAPATVLGLAFVPLALLSGGTMRLVCGVIEIHGGLVSSFLQRGLPWIGSGAAMTLGHVVLGKDAWCLQQSRGHERVHVRQYERWGPLFIPLYLSASLIAYLQGRNPYLDNPFERQAFDQDNHEPKY